MTRAELVGGIALAAAAAACFDGAVALQALETRALETRTVGVGMVRGLLARPRWLAATALAIAGWPLQIAALSLAPLTVVQPALALGLVVLLALGVRALAGQVADDSSTLQTTTGVIGTLVSGTFLYLIAAINLVVLVGIVKVFRRMRHGDFDEAALEDQLDNRGFMNRILGGVTKAVTKPWQMYPVGLLFGLGFDTASEVAFLFLAVGAAGAGLPFAAIICLPILFAAGMSLLDTIDGSFMNFAYEWAFSKPVRKIFYNLTITGLSVAVALVIGTIELSGLLAQKLGAHGAVWTWLENIDMNTLGFIIAGMFAVTWLGALALWRFGHIEERWASRAAETEVV